MPPLDESSPEATQNRSNGAIGDGMRSFRRYAATLLVLAVFCLVGLLGFKHLIHEQIRQIAQQMLNDHYHSQGLHFEIGSARFVESKGIQLYGIRIRDLESSETPEMLAADRVQISSKTTFIQLLKGQVQFEKITIDGLRLDAVESELGSWNVEKLFPMPKGDGSGPIPIYLRNSSATIRYGRAGSSANSEGKIVSLSEIEGVVDWEQTHNESANLGSKINGSTEVARTLTESVSATSDQALQSPATPKMFVGLGFTSDRIKRVNVKVCFDPTAGKWCIRFTGDDVDFDQDLLDLIPESICHPAEQLEAIQGQVDFQGWAAGAISATEPLEFEVSGKVSAGRFDDAAIPYPLDDLQAEFQISNEGFQLSNLSSRFGSGRLQIEGEGAFECLFGQVSERPLTITVRGTNIRLEPALRSSLPPDLHRIWDDLSPSGLVDVVVELEQTRTGWKPNAHFDLIDLSLTPKAFPYELTGCHGEVTWKDDVASVDFRGFAGSCLTTIKGTIDNDRTKPSELVIQAPQPIAIDAKLLKALENNPNLQRTIRSLDPQGMMSCALVLRRVGPQQKIGVDWLRIDLRDCRMRYLRFPYPISEIKGAIVYEQGITRFEQLQGKNDGGSIYGKGFVDQAGNITLDLLGDSISLEQELKDALPPALQQLWENLQPRGSIDQIHLEVNFDSRTNSAKYTVHAEEFGSKNRLGHGLSIQPVWFPYRLHDLTGSFDFRDNKITIDQLKAVAGNAIVSTVGRGIVTEAGWHTVFENLSIDSLVVDESFIAALPKGLGDTLRELNPRGPINMIGELTLHSEGGGLPAEPTFFAPPTQGSNAGVELQRELKVDWDIQLDMENGKLFAGREIEHIHGGLRLVGKQDSNGVQQIGTIDVDSMVVDEIQFTNVQGPIRIDANEVALGRWSNVTDQSGIQRPITANFLNGKSRLDLQINLQNVARPFVLQMSIEEASLSEVARQFSSQQSDLDGQAFAWLEMRGDSRGKSSFQGEGNVRLRNAQIYEVPVLLSLLKVLSVKQPDNTAFTSGDIDFRFIDEHFYFDRLILQGDAISLRGIGDMDFDGNLDLEFYTIVGREDRRIPLVSNAFGAASQNMLRIEVGGSLSSPSITQTAFPGLNETLQQLFPDVTTDEPTPIVPGIPSIGRTLRGGRR